VLSLEKQNELNKQEKQFVFAFFILAILNPSPFLPRRFSLGIRQSSNIRLHVELALIPNLSSFFPNDKPSVGFFTINALIPLCLSDLSVVAKTTTASAS
jgi:hypothetical protein